MYRTDSQHRYVIVVFALLFTLTLGAFGPLNRTAKAQSQSDLQGNVVWTVEEASPQPGAKTRGGRLRTDIISPDALLVAPVDRAWTTAGSTGTIDEDSLAIAQAKNFTTTFRPGATGTITVRYNITATDGTTSFCPATTSLIKFRYRNSDATGATAKFSWELHSSNVISGGNTIVTSFASTISPGFNAGSAFLTVTGTLGGVDFDFTNNIYWLEVKVFRTDPLQFSDIGSFQLWESAGTACP